MPFFAIVGHPDAAVQEAREQVRTAIKNSGLTFPMRRFIVNLAPADLKKEGPAYDLPIAVGILMVSGQAEPRHGPALFLGEPQHGPALFLEELGLDGALRHANGILPMVTLARERQIGTVCFPAEDCREAALVEGVKVTPAETLAALVSHPRDEAPIAPAVNRDGWDAVVPTDLLRDMAHARPGVCQAAPEVTACGHCSLGRAGKGRRGTLSTAAVHSAIAVLQVMEMLMLLLWPCSPDGSPENRAFRNCRAKQPNSQEVLY